MESSASIGCVVRNQKDPYQFHCVFSTDPGDKRDYSVYFHSPNGRQELMASCTHNEKYECLFASKGLNLTEDYISVSETFSTQNGSFVCRDGGAPLEQFPCLYSGNSVKPEVMCGMTDIGSNSLHNPGGFGTHDNNQAVIICALLGVVVIIQSLALCFLLFKKITSKRDRESFKNYYLDMITKDDMYYEREQELLNHDWFNEKSKSCDGETGETKGYKQTNRQGNCKKDIKRYPKKKRAVSTKFGFFIRNRRAVTNPGKRKIELSKSEASPEINLQSVDIETPANL